jgi:hypothetical protein
VDGEGADYAVERPGGQRVAQVLHEHRQVAETVPGLLEHAGRAVEQREPGTGDGGEHGGRQQPRAGTQVEHLRRRLVELGHQLGGGAVEAVEVGDEPAPRRVVRLPVPRRLTM